MKISDEYADMLSIIYESSIADATFKLAKLAALNAIIKRRNFDVSVFEVLLEVRAINEIIETAVKEGGVELIQKYQKLFREAVEGKE